MSAISTSALDIINGAMRNIGVLEGGETAQVGEQADALQVLNDMIESWSVDNLLMFASAENVLSFTPGKYQYTIGNPIGGSFIGTLATGSPLLSAIGVLPTNLVVGGTITDIQGAIPPGTTIVSIGGANVTMSANPLFSVPVGEQITYTVPGDFGIQRPLRITNAFTRITASGTTGLDYPIDVATTEETYTAIGLKGIPGPWPIILFYNTTFPLGTLYFYPNPQQAGQLHLWTDTILSDFANITQPLNLPQGYARALKKNLALELASEYGKSAGPLLVKQAHESKMMIKQLNAAPAPVALYDRDIVRTRRNDAGWIYHGGFT